MAGGGGWDVVVVGVVLGVVLANGLLTTTSTIVDEATKPL